MLANSPFAAFALALAIIGSFVSGAIVSGKSHERLMVSLDRLTTAVEKQNALTRQALTTRERF